MTFTWICYKQIMSERGKYIVNTLAANYEYSHGNTDNVKLPLQMQLSGKLKSTSTFFIALFESVLNF